MSYKIVLNSNDRANPIDTANDATYNFNWGVLEEGEYKVSWNLQKTIKSSKFNIIDPYKLFLYYPLNDNISNYATGLPVVDATIQNTTTTISNKRLNITAPANAFSGLQINRVIPCNINTGFTYSCWFNTSSMPTANYGFLLNIQDTLGYGGGRRFFMCLNANRLNINAQYNTEIITLNTTYHFVLTITYENKAVVYLNNVATNTNVFYPNWVNVADKNYIGHRDGNSLIGWMKECRLYNRVITPVEVATLYTAGYN